MTVTTTHRLTRAAYTDELVLPLPGPTDRSALTWLRDVVEHSHPVLRHALPPGWRVLGLRLGRTRAPDNVHGWPVVTDTPDEAVVGTRSRWGFDARLGLSLERDRSEVHFHTALRFDTRAAHTLWVPIAAGHRITVAALLRHAAAR